MANDQVQDVQYPLETPKKLVSNGNRSKRTRKSLKLIFFKTELSIQKIRRTLEKGFTDEWRNDDHFIHLMMYFLQCDGNVALQIEASWIFTNIAAGPYEQTKWVR
jgi:hypothetical protein